MATNKVLVNPELEARLDRCLEECLDIFRDNIPTDLTSLGGIMSVRHDITETEAAELLQRALAVRQQQ
jgi:hypothetical protein